MAIAAVAAGAVRIGAMFARGTGSLLGRSGGMLRKATLRRSKIRRENFVRNKKLNKGLIETRKRREKESLLEASRLGKSPSSGIVKLPGSSFFGKVLKFIGILFVGWLVNNLPKIIKFVQDLIKRIQKLVDSLKNFVKNLGDWFKSIGSIVDAGWSNIKNLDFTDSEGKLKTAMDDLDKAFKGMQTDVEGMKNALTGDINAENSGDDQGGGPSGPPVTGTDAEKYKQFYDMAEKSGAKFPELVAAQFALESAYGSAISGTHNYFGMKATGSESGTMKGTQEVYGGQTVNTTAKFKNYASAQSSVDELVNRWYKDYKGYRGVNNASSASAAADMLRSEGYATDPNYSQKLKKIMRQNASVVKPGGGGSGDGSKKSSGNRTSGYQMAVSVGKMLNKQGYDVWQHPDFNVDTGYTGSGNERVMRRSYDSYHNYGEALDVPIMQRDANGNVVSSPEKLDKLYAYLNQNRSKFNIAELKWKDDANHFDHLHVSFKGGGGSPINGMNMNNIASMPDIGYSTGPKNTIIIMEEEAPPPMMMQQSQSSSPIIMTGASLNSIMKRKLLNDLTYT